MTEALGPTSGLLSPTAGCFARKVDRASWWAADPSAVGDTDPNEFVADLVFPSDQGTVSVYRVRSPDDLVRVAVGMNSNRSSLTEKLFLLLIPEPLVLEAGIEIRESPGETNCACANRLHVDLQYDRTAMVSVVGRLLAANVSLQRMTEAKMKQAVEALRVIGCEAILRSGHGTCRGL